MPKVLLILLLSAFSLPVIIYLAEGLIISRLPRHNRFRRWWSRNLPGALEE